MRRLLAIEYANGDVEDCGFVELLVLRLVETDNDSAVRTAIEWKDEHDVPRTAFLTSDDWDGIYMLDTIIVPIADGSFQIWRFDEAAYEKLCA